MSTYRNARRDQAIADEHLANYLACRVCGQPTEWEVLSNLGARCAACYRDYCGGGRDYPKLTPEDRKTMAQRVRAALSQMGRNTGIAWARDVIAALERGDVAAAKRQQIPLDALPDAGERKAA